MLVYVASEIISVLDSMRHNILLVPLEQIKKENKFSIEVFTVNKIALIWIFFLRVDGFDELKKKNQRKIYFINYHAYVFSKLHRMPLLMMDIYFHTCIVFKIFFIIILLVTILFSYSVSSFFQFQFHWVLIWYIYRCI